MRIRSHYLIKKKLQLGLAFRFLLLSVLFSIFIGFEVYITIWPVVAEAISGLSIALVKKHILFRLIFFSIPVIFVIVIGSIIFTHRIAGPLYRLEKTLDDLIAGKDVDIIRLRKKDEFQGLTQKLNEFIRIIKKSGTPQKK
jgi:signal transduction histidine kinase